MAIFSPERKIMTDLRIVTENDQPQHWEILYFHEYEIRYIVIEGIPQFVLSDLAKVLGYRDAEKATRLLRDSQLSTLSEGTYRDLGGRGSTPTLVTEGGLNRLIMKSQSEIADDFQDWVTDDVLPSIRRTGSYGKTPEIEAPRDYLTALKELVRIEERRVALEVKVKEISAARDEAAEVALYMADQVEVLTPAAEAWQRMVGSTQGSCSVRDATKMFLGLGVRVKERDVWDTLECALDWIYRGSDDRYRARAEHTEKEGGTRRLTSKTQTYTDFDGVEQLAAPQVRLTMKGFDDLYRYLKRSRPSI